MIFLKNVFYIRIDILAQIRSLEKGLPIRKQSTSPVCAEAAERAQQDEESAGQMREHAQKQRTNC